MKIKKADLDLKYHFVVMGTTCNPQVVLTVNREKNLDARWESLPCISHFSPAHFRTFAMIQIFAKHETKR